MLPLREKMQFRARSKSELRELRSGGKVLKCAIGMIDVVTMSVRPSSDLVSIGIGRNCTLYCGLFYSGLSNGVLGLLAQRLALR